MSIHSLGGVLLLDVVLLIVGSALLSSFGAVSSHRDVVRLAGLAWFVGVAALGILISLELMVGIDYGPITVLVSAGALFAVGLVVGSRRSAPADDDLACGRRFGNQLPVVAVGVAILAVILEAQFRAGRLAGLYEWDAMASWVPKSKALYEWGHLSPAFLNQVGNGWYPPLVSVLDALAFSAMGSSDVVTLHLLHWSALVAFAAAVIGLSSRHVPQVMLWPPLLALAAAPVLTQHADSPLADLPLDYFLSLALILVVLWLLGGPPWCLVVASVLLGAAALTKREGLPFVACLVVASLVAGRFASRRSWAPLALMAIPAVLLTVAWDTWIAIEGVRSQSPEIGYLGLFTHLGRVWPSVHLTLHVLYGGSWWVALPLAVVLAIGSATVARAWSLAALGAGYVVLTILVCSWATLSFPVLPFTTNGAVNPIVRLSGAIVLPAMAILPLLLAEAWWPRREPREAPSSGL